MQQKKVQIRNKAGIHCRPSGVIMTTASKFSDHKIVAEAKGRAVNLVSILDLLSMGLQKDDEVTITVEGPQEEEVCAKMAELFTTEFDFI